MPKLNHNKSWNTMSIRHMEMVWKAEIKNREEQRKIMELKKQLEEERQMREIRKSQTGEPQKRVDESLSWMYEPIGVPNNDKQTQEEYLLGIRKIEDKALEDDYTKMKKTNAPGALFVNNRFDFRENGVPAALDQAAKLREDPLFQIKKVQLAELQSKLDNPLILEKLKEKYEKKKKKKKHHSSSSSDEEEDKKKKKKHKKDKKKKKKKHHSSSSSDDEEKDKKHKKHEDDDKKYDDKKYDKKYDEDKKRDDKYEDKKYDDKKYDKKYDDKKYDDKRYDDRKYNDEKYRDRHRHSDDYYRDERKRSRDDRYEDEKRYKREDRREKKRRISELSEEERLRRIEEMKNTAREFHQRRLEDIQKAIEKDKEVDSKYKDPNFLREVKTEAYMKSDVSMEERLKRNIYSIQRNTGDDDANHYKLE